MNGDNRKPFLDRLYDGQWGGPIKSLYYIAPAGASVAAYSANIVGAGIKGILIITAIVLVVLGVILSAMQRVYSKRKTQDSQNITIAYSAIVDSVGHMAKRLSELMNRWDFHTRVTVYACVERAGRPVLCPIARESDNPDLKKPGRHFCKTEEGFLSNVWRGENGGIRTAKFPLDEETRKQWYMDKYHMPEEVVQNLTMFPTSMFGIRLMGNDRDVVGVILFECDDEKDNNKLGTNLLDSLNLVEAKGKRSTLDAARFHELLDVLAGDLYAIREIIPDLIYHRTYHSMPQVSEKELPEH